MRFLMISLVFLMFSMMFAKTSLLFCSSLFDYSKPRCYYSCPYDVMRNLDAIIRVRMLLCETSMLLLYWTSYMYWNPTLATLNSLTSYLFPVKCLYFRSVWVGRYWTLFAYTYPLESHFYGSKGS